MNKTKFFIVVGKLYIFFSITFLLSSYTPNPYATIVESVEEQGRPKMIFLPTINVFNEQKLINYLNEINIKFPEIVFAQAKLESSNFTSDIFLENHNFFGMKCATKRAFLHKGENRGHAKYENWKECVIDYALYQATYLHHIKTKQQYLSYLRKHYAEDPNYVDKLIQLMEDDGR